jgi:hypothetical protein
MTSEGLHDPQNASQCERQLQQMAQKGGAHVIMA